MDTGLAVSDAARGRVAGPRKADAMTNTNDMPSTKPTTVIGYVRAARDDDGTALARQREHIQKMAELWGWTLTAVYEDTGSGLSYQRPGLSQALDALDAGTGSVLVVDDVHRLTRSAPVYGRIFERAQQHGWDIVAPTSGLDTREPIRKAMSHLLAAMDGRHD